jgi:hypothetical protein
MTTSYPVLEICNNLPGLLRWNRIALHWFSRHPAFGSETYIATSLKHETVPILDMEQALGGGGRVRKCLKEEAFAGRVLETDSEWSDMPSTQSPRDSSQTPSQMVGSATLKVVKYQHLAVK